MSAEPLTVRSLIALLSEADPDALVELSVWSGKPAIWHTVKAERVSQQTVYTYDPQPEKVVQIWTPATSSQYAKRDGGAG